MGIEINYLIELVIKKRFKKIALRKINFLHTLEGLKKYVGRAKRGNSPRIQDLKSTLEARKYIWYSWVENPPGSRGFKSLYEAFDSWKLANLEVNIHDVDGEDFTYSGKYDGKYGSQEILLLTIAPYLKSFSFESDILRESEAQIDWKIEKGICNWFMTVSVYPVDNEPIPIHNSNPIDPRTFRIAVVEEGRRRSRMKDVFYEFLLGWKCRGGVLSRVNFGLIPFNLVRFEIFEYYMDH